MYKAVIVNSLSNDFSSIEVVDVERKQLEANEIRIQVKAASVNFPDLLMTEGLYQYKPETPFILGMESSGIIIEKGTEGLSFGKLELTLIKLIFSIRLFTFTPETSLIGYKATPSATNKEDIPPQPLNRATVSGIAVIGTFLAVIKPYIIARTPAMHEKIKICSISFPIIINFFVQ